SQQVMPRLAGPGKSRSGISTSFRRDSYHPVSGFLALPGGAHYCYFQLVKPENHHPPSPPLTRLLWAVGCGMALILMITGAQQHPPHSPPAIHPARPQPILSPGVMPPVPAAVPAAAPPPGIRTAYPAGRGSLLTIPVVVHVIHDPATGGDAAPYPDDASIYAGIDWINNLLAGGPACAGDPASVETGIRLCPATRDISGGATSGIQRFADKLTDMDLCAEDALLKAIPRAQANRFPDTAYLNLYIVRGIRASCQPDDSLAGGYAAYPAAHGTPYDGIVLEAVTWMHPDCHVRKVILHELGHYLNLRHTWEGNACTNDNCLIDGDGVCDTPPDYDINIYPSNPCLQGMPVNTCFSDVNPADPNNPFVADQP